jgi:uncharacterized membrane protein YphA (DoxX/SURF4 family)
MKYFIWFCRIVIGVLFIFSGYVKAVDPIGMQYKLEEYFEVFHMDFFIPYALYFSILLNALEIVLGVFTIFGVRMVQTAWLLVLIITFFLFLTGYSAVTNKITDCGCFGDAIKLSTWATFYKNVIFLGLIIPIFLWRNKIEPLFNKSISNIIYLGSIIACLGLEWYCLEHLPIIDFRPYKVGNNIREQMRIPPGAPRDSVVTKLIYKDKRTGTEQAYLMSELPWADSIWMANNEFVKQENQIVREGYQPKIKDFKVWDDGNNDLTAQLLDSNKYQIWVIAYDVSKTNIAGMEKIATSITSWENTGIKVMGLSASSYDAIEELRHNTNSAYPFYYADGTVLKTIIRANPGIVLLHGANVLAMWHYNDTPSAEEVKKYLK